LCKRETAQHQSQISYEREKTRAKERGDVVRPRSGEESFNPEKDDDDDDDFNVGLGGEFALSALLFGFAPNKNLNFE
jgi:hypothetical protein